MSLTSQRAFDASYRYIPAAAEDQLAEAWGNPVNDLIEDLFAMPPQTSFRREVRDAKRDEGER